MNIDISDVARVMAALSPEARASLDDRVAKLQREAALLREQAIAELRALSDNDVVIRALSAGKSAGRVLQDNLSTIDVDEVLRVLRDAGFSREDPKQNIEFIFPEGQHIKIYGDHASLGAVKAHLCGAIPGLKYSKT